NASVGISGRKRPEPPTPGQITRRKPLSRLPACSAGLTDAMQLYHRLKGRNGLCSYRVKFPGVAEIVDEHPPKRQQQAAAAKAPEITPFTS
ncbi:TPA: hypothetical protein ACQZAZ_004710, partial [Escherichia coli]